MSFASSPQPYLWRHRPFLHYLASRSLSEFSSQIAAVAVGWQIYALTHSALDLGLAGLVQFVPSALLMLPAGHAADRYARNRVVLVCSSLEALVAAYLAWSSYSGHVTVTAIYAALALFGIASAFDSPASAAMLPLVTSEEQFQRGTALSTGAWQFAAITGPAAGGLLYALAPTAPYIVMSALSFSSAVLIRTMNLREVQRVDAPATSATLFAGVAFVRRNPAILGTISLDLFAVLLGGATALLPIYASDILHTGAWGTRGFTGDAFARRFADDRGTSPLRHYQPCRLENVSGCDRVRACHSGVRCFARLMDLDHCACRHGCCRHGQRGRSILAGATDDAR